jgi:hypothetical protein
MELDPKGMLNPDVLIDREMDVSIRRDDSVLIVIARSARAKQSIQRRKRQQGLLRFARNDG